MRILLDTLDAASDDLAELYRAPRTPWLRVNMVSTLDGAANGDSGTSGSINNTADKAVFDELRAQADAILVGAGTARTEGYRVTGVPLVLVSRSAQVPEGLRDAPRGKVLLATCSASSGLDEAVALLGEQNVIVVGTSEVDLGELRTALVARGLVSLLCEGGPHLLRDLLAAGVVDELCLTVVPSLIGGVHPRIVMGESVAATARPAVLLENEGTLLGRWFVGD